MIHETAGGTARTALQGRGLIVCSILCLLLCLILCLILDPVLTAAPAACNGTFRQFAAGLTIEETETPRHPLINPYRPVFLTEDGAEDDPPQWQKECGTWAIRRFALHTKVQQPADSPQSQDRLVGRPAAAPNGVQNAGYSKGGDDVFVVPLLLLAQPGSDEAELKDRRVKDVRIYGHQPFQQLKFMLPDISIRSRWRFQPVSASLRVDGVPGVVHFVVSCGEAPCSGGELAEAASLAEWRRHWPPR
jgi:hypothetical protein